MKMAPRDVYIGTFGPRLVEPVWGGVRSVAFLEKVCDEGLGLEVSKVCSPLPPACG